MPPSLRSDPGGRDHSIHRRDSQQHKHNHLRPGASPGAHILRGCRPHDLGPDRPAHPGPTHREVHASAERCLGLDNRHGNQRMQHAQRARSCQTARQYS